MNNNSSRSVRSHARIFFCIISLGLLFGVIRSFAAEPVPRFPDRDEFAIARRSLDPAYVKGISGKIKNSQQFQVLDIIKRPGPGDLELLWIVYYMPMSAEEAMTSYVDYAQHVNGKVGIAKAKLVDPVDPDAGGRLSASGPNFIDYTIKVQIPISPIKPTSRYIVEHRLFRATSQGNVTGGTYGSRWKLDLPRTRAASNGLFAGLKKPVDIRGYQALTPVNWEPEGGKPAQQGLIGVSFSFQQASLSGFTPGTANSVSEKGHIDEVSGYAQEWPRRRASMTAEAARTFADCRAIVNQAPIIDLANPPD